MKKIILKIYISISKKLSRGKGFGKKYKIINSTVNKIETSLKSGTADVWAGKMFLHPNDGLRLSIRGIHNEEEAMMVTKTAPAAARLDTKVGAFGNLGMGAPIVNAPVSNRSTNTSNHISSSSTSLINQDRIFDKLSFVG